tara:strand:- start:1378 stop:2490 length:1113 start_codon:yes stop_codon:yes gene_type:complete
LFQFKNKSILILSPENWGKNQLSKHLYAKELSKQNTVYFLHTSPHPNQQDFIETQKIEHNIILIHVKNIVKGINKLPSFLIDFQNKSIIHKILKDIKQPIDVVWSFDQSKFQNLKQFKAPIKIFHPVDFIEKATPYLTRIANSADVVLSVSQAILDTISTSTPKHFINHGLDELFTKKASAPVPTFIKKNKINVGYVGNLQMKLIDWNALINTVKSNSTINFVFIGPDKVSNIGGNKTFDQLNVIKNFPNTFFTGSLSKQNLHDSLPFFDVFLICYNHIEFPLHVSNSHKILEYLSTGKVIVSNYISTYKSLNLIEMVKDNSFLSTKLKDVTQNLEQYNSTENQKKRIKYAVNNTYSEQIERIEDIIIKL